MNDDNVKVTPEQIVARIEAVKEDDFFGAQVSDLLGRLPYELAKPYLKHGVTVQEFEAAVDLLTGPLAACKDYLPFAWDKANNCRGLSAGRSLHHMSAWLFLAGYGALVDEHFQDYSHYGKKQLVMASLLCDFDWTEHDDKKWRNDEVGKPLSDLARGDQVRDAYRIVAALQGAKT